MELLAHLSWNDSTHNEMHFAPPGDHLKVQGSESLPIRIKVSTRPGEAINTCRAFRLVHSSFKLTTTYPEMAAMKLFFTCVAALCLFQALNATVMRRSTDTEAAADNTIMEDARRVVTEALTKVQTAIGLDHTPNHEEVIASIKNNSQALADRVVAIVAELHTAISTHSGELAVQMQTAMDHMNATAAKLQEEHPEVSAQASELKANLDNNMQSIMTEASKLFDMVREHGAAIGENIHTIARSAADQTAAVAKELSEQVQTAVEHHQAGH